MAGKPALGPNGKPLVNASGIPALCISDGCCNDGLDCEDEITKTFGCGVPCVCDDLVTPHRDCTLFLSGFTTTTCPPANVDSCGPGLDGGCCTDALPLNDTFTAIREAASCDWNLSGSNSYIVELGCIASTTSTNPAACTPYKSTVSLEANIFCKEATNPPTWTYRATVSVGIDGVPFNGILGIEWRKDVQTNTPGQSVSFTPADIFVLNESVNITGANASCTVAF